MLITSKSSTISGREWLAEHDPKKPPSPRFERLEARRKAHQQQRMQQRHYLATPVLKGVQ
jgi:hypothetical protein